MDVSIKRGMVLASCLVIVWAMGLPMARTALGAETLNLFYTVEREGFPFAAAPAPAAPRKIAERRTMAVDENGDVVIRHPNATLVLAYSAPDDGLGFRDRMRDLPSRECAAVYGFSVKMKIPF
ncbi:MAG TPA: hypothetical protein VIH45_07025 [Desulfuromonadaceae bacterium]